ncbi:hypothetical protein TRVL_03920 [Trypanosoma vivax]|nr:hypothetical protein TRVL_03920 [Trypanosoma vivax]
MPETNRGGGGGGGGLGDARHREHLVRLPDTHNCFCTLVEHTLTYIVVSGGELNDSDSSTLTVHQTSETNTVSGGISGARHETGVQVLYAVNLSCHSGTAPLCFAVGNRSLYGIDTALVGFSCGALAVVVMCSGGIVWIQRPNEPETQVNVFENTARAMTEAALPLMEPRVPQPCNLSRPNVPFASLVNSAMVKSPHDYDVGTITWLPDRPLVFVGFTSGHAEWYHVTVEYEKVLGSLAGGSERAAAVSGAGRECLPIVRDVRCRKIAWQQAKPEHVGAKRRTHVNGDGDGVHIRLYNRCCFHINFPDAGGFLTSDWLPSSGYVVAGAERAIFVLSSGQPDVPLHCLPSWGCSFLTCHPVYPLIACLTFDHCLMPSESPLSGDADSVGGCRLRVLECGSGGLLSQISEKGVPAADSDSPPSDKFSFQCEWEFHSNLQLVLTDLGRGRAQLFNLDCACDDEVLPTGTENSCHERQQVYTFSPGRELQVPLDSLAGSAYLSAATHSLPTHTVPASNSVSPFDTTVASTDRHGPVSREMVVPLERILAQRMQQRTCRRRRNLRSDASLSPQSSQRSRATRHSSIVRPGFGPFSCVVCVDRHGKVAIVPVHGETTVVRLHSNQFVVGLSCSVLQICLPNEVSTQSRASNAISTGEVVAFEGDCNSDSFSAALVDTATLMITRLKEGFGIPSAANAEAQHRRLHTYTYEEDVGLVSAFISTMEKVGLAGNYGSVPSVVELLMLANAPDATQLTDLKMLPQNTAVVCSSSMSANDSRRLLLLHLLNWVPTLSLDSLQLKKQYVSRAEVERTVVVNALHKRRQHAAAILRRAAHLDATYVSVASVLEEYENIFSGQGSCFTEVCERFVRQLSPWLRIIFACENSKSSVYEDSAVPLWDRIAVALILEHDTLRLVALLHKTFAPQCSMLQRLLLFEGVGEGSCASMQRIVDCTGDFQMAACLFARIGIPATHDVFLSVGSPERVCRDPQKEHCGDKLKVAAAHSWDLWATAYRTFLNQEGQFVKRAMFDSECQQLLVRATVAKDNDTKSFQSFSFCRRRCSVCAAHVLPRPQHATDSYAWCAVCGHGGHARHLLEWFSSHRTCAADGCSCHCVQGEGMLQ